MTQVNVIRTSECLVLEENEGAIVKYLCQLPGLHYLIPSMSINTNRYVLSATVLLGTRPYKITSIKLNRGQV